MTENINGETTSRENLSSKLPFVQVSLYLIAYSITLQMEPKKENGRNTRYQYHGESLQVCYVMISSKINKPSGKVSHRPSFFAFARR